jgi:CRP-like cAMP-binding protein
MVDASQTHEDQAVFVVRRLEEAGVPVARRNYAAGELLYASGDADGYLCFLLEGQVRVYKPYGAYKEATVAVSKEMACLEREGYIETRNRERKIVLLDHGRLGELAR